MTAPEGDGGLARWLALDREAVAHTGAVVARVSAADLGRPTPCAAWDVHALLDHVVGGNLLYAAAAAGGEPDWARRHDDHLGDDHVGAYERSAEAVGAAFAGAAASGAAVALPFGALPPAVAIPIHAVDVLVHGWDLAAACGLDRRLDDRLVRAALGTIAAYPDDTWGDPRYFAHRVTPRAGASPTEALVAAVGRDPGWRPPG